MANYSSGPEWGRMIAGFDPGRSFADSFLQSFKENIAYKLAEKKDALDRKMKQQEQKALEDWRNLQMMVKKMEMDESRKQFNQKMETIKQEWEAGAPVREYEAAKAKYGIQYLEKGQIPPWDMPQMTPVDPALQAQRYAGAGLSQAHTDVYQQMAKEKELENQLLEQALKSGGSGGLGLDSLNQPQGQQYSPSWMQTPARQSYIGRHDEAVMRMKEIAGGYANADEETRANLMSEIIRIGVESNVLQEGKHYDKKGNLTESGVTMLKGILGVKVQ